MVHFFRRPTILALGALLCLAGPSPAKDRPARVTGTIVDEHGAAVAGATVTLDSDREQLSAQSAEDGTFSIDVADARESFRIVVGKEGHERLEDVLHLKPGMHQSLSLTLPTTLRRELKEAYDEAVEALFAEDYATARAGFGRALELDPNLAPAILALARLDLVDGASEQAVQRFERYLELEEGDASVWAGLFEAYTGAGEVAKAQELVDRLVGTDEGRNLAAKAHNEGVRRYQANDRIVAKRHFAAALMLQPDLVPTLAVQSALHFNDGELREAAELAGRLLELEPGHREALRIRYFALENLGEEAKANEAFDAFAAAAPEEGAELLVDLAKERFLGNDAAGARRLLERALTLRPDLPRAHYELGLCLSSLGHKKEARAALQRFLELAPDDPEAAAAREMLQYL